MAENEDIKQRIESAKEANSLESEALEIAKEQLKEKQKAIKSLEEQIEKTRKLTETQIFFGDLEAERLANVKKTLQEQEEQLKKINAEYEQKEQQIDKIRKRQKEVNQEISKGIDLLKGFFTGSAQSNARKAIGLLGSDIEEKITKKLVEARMAGNAASLSMAAMGGAAVVGAILIFQKALFELAVQVGNAENAFMKATGASEDFARSLSDSFIETRRFGATAQEASAAMQSLFTNFTDFTMLNEQSVENLTKTATVLGKMGVSTDDFAKGIQNLTKAMGFNADAAAQQL